MRRFKFEPCFKPQGKSTNGQRKGFVAHLSVREDIDPLLSFGLSSAVPASGGAAMNVVTGPVHRLVVLRRLGAGNDTADSILDEASDVTDTTAAAEAATAAVCLAITSFSLSSAALARASAASVYQKTQNGTVKKHQVATDSSHALVVTIDAAKLSLFFSVCLSMHLSRHKFSTSVYTCIYTCIHISTCSLAVLSFFNSCLLCSSKRSASSSASCASCSARSAI